MDGQMCLSTLSLDGRTANRLLKYVPLLILASQNLFSEIHAELKPNGSSYENLKALKEYLYSPDRYSKDFRPLNNLSDAIKVSGIFNLLSVMSIDDIQQETVIKGYFIMSWRDERIKWNRDDYGGRDILHLTDGMPWVPHMRIVNTVTEECQSLDANSYLAVRSDGTTQWIPGGAYRMPCNLNLRRFPFDTQECIIRMCSRYYPMSELQFFFNTSVVRALYMPNAGWEVLEAKLANEQVSTDGLTDAFSCPTVHFRMKRRPTTIVLNVILPVILLSLLNNLVFLFPPDSGQNIGYAMTVLLSMTVFLGTVSSMTPQVSDVVPALTIYLFVLLLTSVATVSVVILTEHLHRHGETQDPNQPQIRNLSLLPQSHRILHAISQILEDTSSFGTHNYLRKHVLDDRTTLQSSTPPPLTLQQSQMSTATPSQNSEDKQFYDTHKTKQWRGLSPELPKINTPIHHSENKSCCPHKITKWSGLSNEHPKKHVASQNFENKQFDDTHQIEECEEHSLQSPQIHTTSQRSEDQSFDDGNKTKTSRRRLARKINISFFVIVMSTWSVATVWFFTFTTTSP